MLAVLLCVSDSNVLFRVASEGLKMVSMSWSEIPSAKPSFEELSVQSLDAAIDLDRLQRGENIDAQTINSLANSLGFREEHSWTADAFKRYTNPKTMDIYSRTVANLTKIQPSTIGELVAKIREIAEVFAKDVKAVDADDLQRMRDFCLALHRELLAETYDRHSEVSERP